MEPHPARFASFREMRSMSGTKPRKSLRDFSEQREAALLAMEKALAWDSNSRSAAICLARMLLVVNRPDELRRVARHVQRLEPSRAEGFIWEGMSWQQQGNPQAAADAYAQALTRNATQPVALFNLAELFREQGRLEEASKLYQAFLQTDSGPLSTPQRSYAQTFLNQHGRSHR